MKQSNPHPNLRIYHSVSWNNTEYKHSSTQKMLDIAVIIISFAGLVSAVTFLVTLS